MNVMPSEEAWENAAESSREAAAWALKLFGGFQNAGTMAAADELFEHLETLSVDRRSTLLIQLVSLVGRAGVASPDVATFKVRLRMMSTMEVPGESPAPRINDVT